MTLLSNDFKKNWAGIGEFFLGGEFSLFYSPSPPYAADPMLVIRTLIKVNMFSMGPAA